MKLPVSVDNFETLTSLKGPLHLAIGVFDGVHLGHKAVIESAVFSGRRDGGVSGVLTFDPHPSRLFRPEDPTRLIMPINEKCLMLHHLGVDVVIRKRFDRDYASIPAEAFLSRLKEALPALKAIYVGSNFRFGSKRAGDVQTLIETGKALGVAVFSVDRIKHNGEPISSTRIRNELVAGAIESVNDLLGYNYFCDGRVVGGAKLGRQIGFPTLNVPWQPECRPCFGVYFVRFRESGANQWFDAVANYGIKPTVSTDDVPVLELHALKKTEFGEGDALVVEWLHFIRSEKKFESIDALKEQIEMDCAHARKLAEYG